MQFLLHSIFQTSVENQILFAAVRNHFDFPHHDVRTVGPALHAGGKCQLEFSDAFGFQRELRSADARGIDGD